MSRQAMFQELIKIIKKKKPGKEKLVKLKVKLCKKHHVREVPTDIQILLHATPEDIAKLKLVTKPARTQSGVAPVAIMSYPFPCPHTKKGIGPCIMCPGGPSSVFGDIPQSYTGKEPATMRALRNNFDPYLQVMNRLEQYIVQGHIPDKVELIIMGGTFPSFNKRYQENFIKYAFKALNDFSNLFFKQNKFDFTYFKEFFGLPSDIGDKKRIKDIQNKLKKIKKHGISAWASIASTWRMEGAGRRKTKTFAEKSRSSVGGQTKTTLEKEQTRNEASNIRCIGLTIETRSDYAKLEQANEMLRLGCTRVELGVQSVYEKALKAINRGHCVEDTIKAFALLKDLGFKINAHYMPGLPGINKKQDLAGLKELFSNPQYRPDMLKIYPCMVVEGTKLYKQWKKKKYKPLTTKQAAKMIAEFKKNVPPYLRIMRVQRDIPTYATAAGVDKTNLRQYIHQIMQKKGIKCNCIRCREVGRAKNPGKPKIKTIHYTASNGTEFFISAEDKDYIFGFCRLRFPNKSLRKEITPDSAIIRELHVYGPATQIGKKGLVQHKGIGKALLKTAEKIAKTYYKNKMVVISGIGVKPYYKKLNYTKQGPYMIKKL